MMNPYPLRLLSRVLRQLSCHLEPFNIATVLLLAIVQAAIAQGDAGSRTASRKDAKANGAFGEVRLHRGPYEKDGAGLLAKAGYADSRATYQRTNYQSLIDRLGEANVQVALHPLAYAYVVHDFCGVFGAVRREIETHGTKDKREAKRDLVEPKYVERVVDGRTHLVCYLELENKPGQSGLLGWYRQGGDELRTVFVSFEHLGDVPWALVDHLLAQYPSTVITPIDEFKDWETKDLEKWAEVLRANKDDLRMLQAGAAYLTRYDRRSFGLLDALRKRNDAAAYAQALDGVVERIGRVAAQRKAKVREPGQRGE